jgi:hypothetical protein
MRTVVRAATLATGAVFATVLLVACNEGGPEVPTIVESSSSSASTVDSSVMTSSSNTTGLAASDDGRPAGPPEEALAACNGLAAEADCSFTSPRDGSAVDGTCHAHRDDANQLVCRPNDWPGRGPRGDGQWGPPEEALSACEGIETGTACSFEAPFGTVNGTCQARPDGSGEVACRPEGDGEGRGPGGRGPGREEARAACSDKQADESCSFESPFGSVDGTCRTGRDGTSLICAPTNRPGR